MKQFGGHLLPMGIETDQHRSDRELAAAACAGSRAAFDLLVSRHREAVYGLAWHFLRSADEADEAAQEAFVRAYQRLDRFDGNRQFGPWVRGIAVKVCTEMTRRRRRVRPADLSQQEPPVTSGAASTDTALCVQEALRQLPEAYRLPLVLFYLDEASVQQVAQALGLSAVAVRVRLHRGREMLKKILRTTFGKEAVDSGLPQHTQTSRASLQP